MNREHFKQNPAILQIMTTEHYNLQSGRSNSIADTSSRANLFLSTVSMTLIALSFIGQISQLGTPFFIFSFILFPSLLFLGFVTFDRVLQSAIEDIIYARGINRIRHFYGELAPEIKEYFVLSTHDDETSAYNNMGTKATWWQVFLTTPGTIAVINGILAGVFVGLLVYQLFQLTLVGCIITAIVVCSTVIVILHRYQWVTWGNAQRNLKSLFPRNSTI